MFGCSLLVIEIVGPIFIGSLGAHYWLLQLLHLFCLLWLVVVVVVVIHAIPPVVDVKVLMVVKVAVVVAVVAVVGVGIFGVLCVKPVEVEVVGVDLSAGCFHLHWRFGLDINYKRPVITLYE